MNYFNDPRVRRKPSTELEKFEDCYEAELPKRKIVCPTCNGTGKHVNPSIDSHGLSASDFHEDPDFAESYFSGTYDVTCYECGGDNVVDEVDFERAERECPELLQDWENWLQSGYDMDAEYAAERRMGA